jgi:hypothetical protein
MNNYLCKGDCRVSRLKGVPRNDIIVRILLQLTNHFKSIYYIYMSKSSHYDTAKAVVAFLAVALMAGVFLVFAKNKDSIIESGQFYYFMTLAVVGAGFLIGLLYLAGKPVQKSKAISHKTAERKAHKKR